MKSYRAMTLQDLIDELWALPQTAVVDGLEPSVHSYRGFYEQNAIGFEAGLLLNAHELAQALTKEIGSTLHGWKGGEFPCDPAQPVYLADVGDTGDMIVGIEQRSGEDPYIYEPVVTSYRWW